MANKNNKANSNHRHVLKKRKLLVKTQNIQPAKLRIVNLDKLCEYTAELNAHSTRCQGAIRLIGECRNGLTSILNGKCGTCGHTVVHQTSKKVRGPRGTSR